MKFTSTNRCAFLVIINFEILSTEFSNFLFDCRFAETVNSVFQYMIFLQFCISSIVLCLSVYQFSTVDPFSMNFLWSGFYLCCMLMQVYLYCWFGNEVTLKVGTAFRFYSTATYIFECNSTE